MLAFKRLAQFFGSKTPLILTLIFLSFQCASVQAASNPWFTFSGADPCGQLFTADEAGKVGQKFVECLNATPPPSGIVSWQSTIDSCQVYSEGNDQQYNNFGYAQCVYHTSRIFVDGYGDTVTNELLPISRCQPGREFFETHDSHGWQCVLSEDTWQTPDMCLRVGSPLIPLAGAKSLTEVISGVQLAGGELTLEYSTLNQVPSNHFYGISRLPLPPAMGPLWTSSFHKKLVNQNDFMNVLRENGTWTSFLPTSGAYTPNPSVKDSFHYETYHGALVMVDALKRVFEYYNFDGKLLFTSAAGGGGWQYTYSDESTPISIAPQAGLIILVSDQFGRSVSFKYSLATGASSPLVSQIVNAVGDTTNLEYDAAGNLAKIIWPDGFYRRFVYENSALPWAVSGVIDENNDRVTTYAYDGNGLATDTQRSGGVFHYGVAYAATPYWNIVETRDANIADLIRRDHIFVTPAAAQITMPNGSVSSWQASAIGGTTRLTNQSQPAGVGCAASNMSVSYDVNANPVKIDDFNGNRICSVYEQSRNLETVHVDGLSNATSCSSVISAGTTLPTGSRKASTEWHPIWRLETRRAESKSLTSYIYNGQPDSFNGGALASCAGGATIADAVTPIAVLCKKVEQATTDVDGHLGFSATVTGMPRIWQWTYNADGQVLTADGPRTDVTDQTANVYRSADDTAVPKKYRRGDLFTVTDAKGNVTTFAEYDGNGKPTKMVDPNGLTTVLAYSPRGWLTSRAVTGGGVTETTTYAYDGVGQLKKATQPDGSFVSYTYDAAHRLTDVIDSLNNKVHYTLDAMGNRTQEQTTDPSGTLTRNIARTYDALNRLQQVTGGIQ